MRISVCMATYNGEKYIKEQIDSILCQLSPNDELVISDDSSSDNTIKIIESFKDKRIKLFKDNVYKNPIFNFENALKKSKGEYIFLSDQDDIWKPNKIKRLIEELQKFDLVFSNAVLVDESLNIIEPKLYKSTKNVGLFQNLFFNRYTGATMAFKRVILTKALPFPPKITMHDQWLGIIGEYYFKTGFIDESLILFRRHGDTASFSGGKSKNSLWRKIQFRFNILSVFIKRIMK